MDSSEITDSALQDRHPLIPDDSLLDTVVVPVIVEQLHIDKQMVETGRVRLVKTVHQDEQTITIPILREEVSVERVALNQYVDEPPLTRQEGDTTIYSVLKEVVVTEKRLLLVEEIRVTKRQVETQETQSVTLRREEVNVERIDATHERPV